MIRILILLIIAVVVGILNAGIIGALPFPYSEFPLFPLIIALALVLRARPTIFWSILIALAVTDLYRGAGFGIGILCLIFLTMLGHRVSSEMVTHRSLLGCIVIGALVGALWSVS